MTRTIYKYVVPPEGVTIKASIVKWLSAAVDPRNNIVAYAVVDTGQEALEAEYRIFSIVTGGDAEEVDVCGAHGNELLATQFLGTVKVDQMFMIHIFVRLLQSTFTKKEEA